MKPPQIAALPGMSPLGFASPKDALRYHVSGAIDRGEAVAIVEIPVHGHWHATGEYIRDENEGMIGEATNLWANVKTPIGDRRANAQLMAAAPDLIAALRALLATNSCREATYNSNVGLAEAVDVARAAIAKAEGR